MADQEFKVAQDMYRAIAKLVVKCNIENYKEYTDTPTAEDFVDYGTNEDTILPTLQHHMDEIVKAVEKLQAEVAPLIFD